MDVRNIFSLNKSQFSTTTLYLALVTLSCTISLVTADEVCVAGNGEICPANTCCRQQICDDKESPFKCCDEDEKKRKGRFCSNCLACVDCKWKDWGKCIYEECTMNGLQPQMVNGVRFREYEVEQESGGKPCEGNQTRQSCPRKHCPEHCQLGDMGSYSCTNEKEGCGICVRSAKVIVKDKHGGKQCEITEDKERFPCPGDDNSTNIFIGIIIGSIITVVCMLLGKCACKKWKSSNGSSTDKDQNQSPTSEGPPQLLTIPTTDNDAIRNSSVGKQTPFLKEEPSNEIQNTGNGAQMNIRTPVMDDDVDNPSVRRRNYSDKQSIVKKMPIIIKSTSKNVKYHINAKKCLKSHDRISISEGRENIKNSCKGLQRIKKEESDNFRMPYGENLVF